MFIGFWTLWFILLLYWLFELWGSKKEEYLHKKEIEQRKKDYPRTAELMKKYCG